MALTSTLPGRPRSPRRPGRTPWLDWMAVPAMLVLGIVVVYPIVRAVLISFESRDLLSSEPAGFVGLSNYDRLIQDAVFWQSVRNTLLFTGISVVGAGLIGLLLALATENLGGPWRVMRSVLLTPWALPVIVVAFLFRYVFDQNGGVVNAVLLDLGLIETPVPWLVSSTWALPAVIFANIWAQAPFFMLLFTAALAGVPNDVVEAARIDRAGVWALTWHIKLPFLRGAALIGSLLMVIQNFNNFPLIWSMTEGGPAYSTSTLVVYVYRLAFTSFDLGYASAVGVVWLVVLLLFAAMYVRALRGERT